MNACYLGWHLTSAPVDEEHQFRKYLRVWWVRPSITGVHNMCRCGAERVMGEHESVSPWTRITPELLSLDKLWFYIIDYCEHIHSSWAVSSVNLKTVMEEIRANLWVSWTSSQSFSTITRWWRYFNIVLQQLYLFNLNFEIQCVWN